MKYPMGFQLGLESGLHCKRQFRWLFTVDGIVGGVGGMSAPALPPEKSARPNISFKENQVHHLIEDVFYPAKPDWKPITVTVYDLKKNSNPLFNWILKIYSSGRSLSEGSQSSKGYFMPPAVFRGGQNSFIKTAKLDMLDGCGNAIESWDFEDAWPQTINFQTLDMTQNGLVMAEITLRYARAYIRL